MEIIRKNKKDQKRREVYKKYEKQKNIYKMLRRNEMLDIEARYFFNTKLINSIKDSSISRIKNRCILTGRSKGIIKDYKISRLKFREYMKLGLINGISKLSY